LTWKTTKKFREKSRDPYGIFPIFLIIRYLYVFILINLIDLILTVIILFRYSRVSLRDRLGFEGSYAAISLLLTLLNPPVLLELGQHRSLMLNSRVVISPDHRHPTIIERVQALRHYINRRPLLSIISLRVLEQQPTGAVELTQLHVLATVQLLFDVTEADRVLDLIEVVRLNTDIHRHDEHLSIRMREYVLEQLLAVVHPGIGGNLAAAVACLSTGKLLPA